MPPSIRRFTRVAVVQMDYHPAALLDRRSPLEDPLFELGKPDSLLPETGVVPRGLESRFRDLRRRIREAYDDQLLHRVRAILTTCRSWGVEVIVFPEYSVPWEILGGIVDAAGSMVVVAGTHAVERDARKSKVYQKLGYAQVPELGTAVCPVLHEGRLLTLQPKLNPARPEQGSMRPGQAWHPVSLPPGIPGPLGVMICLDFLYRESELHRGLVGPGLEESRFLAVPSLTPHFTIPEFTSKAWEEARRYGRPVLYADIASGGGTSVFVDEGDVSDLRLFPERAGYLEPGDEGVIVADVDLGYVRTGRSTRYAQENPVKPFAAASLVYRAHPIGDRYADFLEALRVEEAVEVETILDELQAKRELLLDAGAVAGTKMRERRMRRMLGELEYTTDPEDLRRFTREILLPPELLPLTPLRQALARGAADVVFAWLREGHRSGLEGVESRLRQAARPLENLDPASWTAGGLRGLALVSEAVHEPPAPAKEVPPAGAEVPVRVILPEGLNPAMMGQQRCKGLILQFGASPDELTWPSPGEEAEPDNEGRRRPEVGASSFVVAFGLSKDLFSLGQAENATRIAALGVRKEGEQRGRAMILLERGGQWFLWRNPDPRFESHEETMMEALRELGFGTVEVEVFTEETLEHRLTPLLARFDQAAEKVATFREERLREVNGHFIEPNPA
jgi:predicted amidohydrolase